jgi:serine phosphatase RsbU (regulator of sigma subunit)
MMHKIFPRRKPRTDLVLFALALVALALVVSLQDYSAFPTPKLELKKTVKRQIDSLLRVRGIANDSVMVFSEAEYDQDGVLAFADTVGVYAARQYLDTAHVQEIDNVVVVRKRAGSISFQLGGSRTRRATYEEDGTSAITANARYNLKMRFNKWGEMIELAEHRAERLNIADTAQLFAMLAERLPRHLQHYAQAPMQAASTIWASTATLGQWSFDGSNSDAPTFTLLLGENAFSRHELQLKAQKIHAKPFVYEVTWYNRWRLQHRSGTEREPEAQQFTRILRQAFGVVLALWIGSMLIVAVVRLRKRAVSVSFALAVAIAASVFLVVSIGMDNSWLAFLVLATTMFAFVGVLMFGAPMAGLMSLTREVFAEKFYTLNRVVFSPHRSFYLGRSILIGFSAALVAEAYFLGISWLLHTLHADRILARLVFSDNYSLSVQAQEGWVTLWAICLFYPLFTFGVVLTPPAVLHYLLEKRMSRRALITLTVITSLVLHALLAAFRADSVAYMLVGSVVTALVGLGVVYFSDILAVGCFSVVLTILSSYPLIAANPVLVWCSVIMLVLLVGVALVAYSAVPEAVSEADYKPKFVLEKEETARLHQELAAAKSVQQRLLPACLPAFDRLEVCATCVPAYEVGGDYYDFFHLDHKRLGVLIGDVSGKGISAAFYITLAKGVIVSQVRQEGSPAEVLHRVNALLYGVMERGKFVSMIYGIFDIETREFTFANAGHNPVLVRRAAHNGAAATAEFINSKGMALGLDAGSRFNAAVKVKSVQLQAGDVVLLYTDGVTEAMNEHTDEYGDERLQRASAASGTSADDLVSGVLQDVRTFTGKAAQHDDITIVAVKVL